MKVSIEFNTDNAAFDDDCAGHRPSDYEISRILRSVVDQMAEGTTEARIRDSNGNTVGEWSWK